MSTERDEIDAIISEINTKESRRKMQAALPRQLKVAPISVSRVTKPPKSKTKNRALLACAVAVVCLGVVSMLHKMISESGPAPVEITVGTAPTMKDSSQFIVDALHRTSDRESAMANMRLDAKSAAFFPVSELKVPEDGSPTTIYCLLRARLDTATEKRWREGGLLQADASSESFVRKVTLKSRNDVDNLYDWHVESVAWALDQIGSSHQTADASSSN